MLVLYLHCLYHNSSCIITSEPMMRCHIRRHRSAFPIKCTVCDHSKNITSGLICMNDLQDENWNAADRGPVAMDCEMVGVGPKMLNALGRVSIVDYSGDVLYDVMVRPEEEITDFRTRWSGIRPEDMRRAIPFECAQEQVERIIHDRTVVGHMIQNDFTVLHLKHPIHLVRDTARAPYAKLVAGFPTKRVISLRALTVRLFGVGIQRNEHCSVEDARATMAIYRLVRDDWEADLVSKAELSKTKKSRRRKSKQQCPSDSAICDKFTSALQPDNLNRSASDTTQSVPNVAFSGSMALESELKRRCQSLPCGPFTHIRKSASSAFLLDDNFWPDDELDAQIE